MPTKPTTRSENQNSKRNGRLKRTKQKRDFHYLLWGKSKNKIEFIRIVRKVKIDKLLKLYMLNRNLTKKVQKESRENFD